MALYDAFISYSHPKDKPIAAALQSVVQKLGKPASEVCRRFEPVPQVLRSVRFKGGRPLENPAVAKAIADATARLGERGRLLVRPSGTEPVIRVMGEADDQALVDALVSDVCAAVAGAA